MTKNTTEWNKKTFAPKERRTARTALAGTSATPAKKHASAPEKHASAAGNSPSGGSTFPRVVDVCIIGAGASGLMCARTATRRGRSVLLVDHAHHPGNKIRISGGGKSNFTNLYMGIEHYISDDPTFCEPALDSFPPQKMLDIMLAHALPWEEREHGQLFGLHTATTLIHALTRDALRSGCVLAMGHRVASLRKEAGGFRLRLTPVSVAKSALTFGDDVSAFGDDVSDTQPGSLSVTAATTTTAAAAHDITAAAVVLATGSPAWPQCGATDQGAEWARQLGHQTLPFAPVLTPFVMPPDWGLHGLAGISLPVTIRSGSYTRTDPLLFTHGGISGPAVLQASCHWSKGMPLTIDFMPHLALGDLLDARECGKLLARTLLARHMPQRLADALLPPEYARRKLAELPRAARTRLQQCVHAHSVVPTGTAGLRRAEAATGGIPTHEVNAWSMESLRCKGLYILGELLNVTGQLGGYNLHWAWASGHMAGQHV